jgi:hypothetical protein
MILVNDSMDIIDYFHLLTVLSYRIIGFYSRAEIGSFECACSNHQHFQHFRKILANRTISKLSYSVHSASWILKRKLKPTKLLMDKYMDEMEIIRATEYASTVDEIFIPDMPDFSLLYTFIGYCPHLRALRVIQRFAFGDTGYLAIAKRCRELVELDIRHMSLLTFKSILQLCVSLRKIDVYEVDELVQDGAALVAIIEHCPNIVSLAARCVDLAKEGVLATMATTCRCLRHIDFGFQSSFSSSDGDFAQFLVNCPPLESLRLRGLIVSGPEMTNIATQCPRLRELAIVDCSGTCNAAIVSICAHCSELKVLELTNYPDMTEIARNCAGLQALSLSSDFYSITDAEVVSIATHCTQLSKLQLSRCNNVNMPAWHTLFLHSAQLTDLHLSRASLSAADFSVLVDCCPHLRKLVIGEPTEVVREQSLRLLSDRLVHLQHLHLSGYQIDITDPVVLHIVTTRTTLRYLHLQRPWYVCEDTQIVEAIARHCPHLSDFAVSCAYPAFHCALRDLRELRAAQAVTFTYSVQGAEAPLINCRCSVLSNLFWKLF